MKNFKKKTFCKSLLPNPERFYSRELGNLKLSISDWANAKCPFHDDHRPSLVVHLRKGYYRCYACGASGDQVQFMMDKYGMTFPEAVEELGAWA